MLLNKRIISNNSGAVIIVIALMFTLLMTILGVAVDAGRLYAVKSKAQNAADAALMGAVSTANTLAPATELKRLFNVNFPNGYMGSKLLTITYSRSAVGVYNATVKISVPLTIMKIFGPATSTVKAVSQVTNGFTGQNLEVALVLDNSATVNVGAIRNGAQNFASALYGGAISVPNVYVSVVPFNDAVNVGAQHISWAQNPGQFTAYSGPPPRGILANRAPDTMIPVIPLNDVTDVIPTDPTTEFRTPYGPAPGTYNNGDYVTQNLALLGFGLNNRVNINNALNAMVATGTTRTNVGLMWGWFTLSSKWQGLWNAALPGLPMLGGATDTKAVILVNGSNNNVYLGQNAICSIHGHFGPCPGPNDNTTSQQLCDAIKAEGIQIYTIGFGNAANYNAALLSYCATASNYNYIASNPSQLTNVLRQIADAINFSNAHLTQ